MLTATVTDISTGLRGEVTLLDSGGGSLANADSTNETYGADAHVTYSASAPGTFYVLVTEPHLGDVPLVGQGRTLPDIASHAYTLTAPAPWCQRRAPAAGGPGGARPTTRRPPAARPPPASPSAPSRWVAGRRSRPAAPRPPPPSPPGRDRA